MRKMLIVIDMQNDFIDGALGTPEAQKIVEPVNKKIKEYDSRGDLVLFTADTHERNYLSTQEGQNLPVEHCIRNTEGWKISPALFRPQDAPVIEKDPFGALHRHLRHFQCTDDKSLPSAGSYKSRQFLLRRSNP